MKGEFKKKYSDWQTRTFSMKEEFKKKYSSLLPQGTQQHKEHLKGLKKMTLAHWKPEKDLYKK